MIKVITPLYTAIVNEGTNNNQVDSGHDWKDHNVWTGLDAPQNVEGRHERDSAHNSHNPSKTTTDKSKNQP